MFAVERCYPDGEDALRDDSIEPLPSLNVGSGVDLTIRELAEAVAAATGFEGAIVWDDSKPDGTPMKQLNVGGLKALDSQAGIPLAERLTSAVALFRGESNRQLRRIINK